MHPRPLARLTALGFGSGASPVAPGTAGSLAALAVAAPLLLWSPWAVAAACLAATLAGLWAIPRCGAAGDPGWVVIDEFAGQFAAVCGLARPSVLGLALAFALFRILDVAKPGPVGWADRKTGAAWVIADDLIAGAITASVLACVRWRWPGALG